MCAYPVNTKHLYNICTMLGQSRRRWANIVQMLYKCFVFAGYGWSFLWILICILTREGRGALKDYNILYRLRLYCMQNNYHIYTVVWHSVDLNKQNKAQKYNIVEYCDRFIIIRIIMTQILFSNDFIFYYSVYCIISTAAPHTTTNIWVGKYFLDLPQ